MITLTAEQDAALDAVSRWYEGQREGSSYPFRLFGPAGTGKTTLAREIASRLGLTDVAFGAYTGKAAQVLRSKGIDATTIHSAIYRPTQSAELHAEHARLTRELADLQLKADQDAWTVRMEEIGLRLNEIEFELRRPMFELNPMSDWGAADLIVLDEVSMVDQRMAEDIESFGVPVLVLGDPEQLPPIGGAGYYTNERWPDVLLTEIHRQALESPVLALATRIRLSRDEHLGVRPGEHQMASVSAAMQADQVLCWRNATRWKLTERIRAKLERPAGLVVPGDRIICLVNNKRDLGVLNGQQFDVLDVKDAWTLLLRECGEAGGERWIEVFPDGFNAADETGLKGRRAFRGEVMAATFANVVTVHKAQGSEWDSVYVIDETPAMMAQEARRSGEAFAIAGARRFLYTAVTRVRESVTLARLRGQ